MKAIVDTNVLLRIFVGDDADQGRAAFEALEAAETLSIGLQALCELAWVLERRYATARQDISAAISKLLTTENVVVNRAAVEAGLAVFDSGGDFADGVIAFEGRLLGGETFVTFDKKASRILRSQGFETKLLAPSSS